MEESGWTPHTGHVSYSCQEFIEIKNTLFFFIRVHSLKFYQLDNIH